MTSEEFERLLSDWLDEPLRADLHGLIESACEQSPELIALRDAWRKSHAATREVPADFYSVVWGKQRADIRAAIDAEIGAIMAPGKRELEGLVTLALPTLGIDWTAQRTKVAARLDEHVSHELRPGPLDNVLSEADPAGVNWKGQRQRIAAATTRATRRMRLLRWTGFAATITAAAAAVAFFFIRQPDMPQPVEPEALARVTIADAPDAAAIDGDSEAALFAIAAPDDLTDPSDSDSEADAGESTELYFSIEPAPVLAAAR